MFKETCVFPLTFWQRLANVGSVFILLVMLRFGYQYYLGAKGDGIFILIHLFSKC